MSRTLTPAQLIERSIQKKYRKQLWTPFVMAIRRYALIEEGDRVAVCVSGGRASMLLAVLMQLLRRISDVPFEVRFLALDPGCNVAERERLEANARLLDIPVAVFGDGASDAAGGAGEFPRRRGRLYSQAKALGCNKIALGHHFNDVIETTVTAMLYGAQLQGMMPRVRSVGFEGMELIRPLYCVHEEDIIAWQRYNNLDFLQSAGDDERRQAVRQLLKTLRRDNPDVEKSVFNAIHAVCLDTFPGWKSRGEAHSFLEAYGERE